MTDFQLLLLKLRFPRKVVSLSSGRHITAVNDCRLYSDKCGFLESFATATNRTYYVPIRMVCCALVDVDDLEMILAYLDGNESSEDEKNRLKESIIF